MNIDGTDIEQTLKLRIIPFTATIRVVPFGSDQPIQPYIGAGVGVYSWRYSETGDFVYPAERCPFPGNFVASGTETGPTILGGVRVPIGPVGVGFEIRYQSAEGNCPGPELFTEGKIDLGRLQLSVHDELQILRKALATEDVEGTRELTVLLSGPPFVPVTSVVALVLWYSARPRALAHTRVSVEKPRILARAHREHVAPFGLFFDHTHSANGCGPLSSAASQMSPLPSCRKSRR